MTRFYFLILVLLAFIGGCSNQNNSSIKKIEFTKGTYASVFYVIEATGNYQIYKNNNASSIIVADKKNGEWRICSEIRCMDVVKWNGYSLTGTISETSNYLLNDGTMCSYSFIESFVLLIVDDNKIDGLNMFEYKDCKSDLNSTIQAYILGVNIKTLF